jgi:hypothetical protein
VLGQVFSTHMTRRSFATSALSDCVPLV